MFWHHIPFLKAVALYSLTAFGGPQGHIGMMMRTFVHKRKDISEQELLEYNAFCQILPGPSSTQTVVLIALKKGGLPLAVVTLLIWLLPAVAVMSAFSFLVRYIDTRAVLQNLFIYIKPMSVGFVCYTAMRMMKGTVQHPATRMIMLGSFGVMLLVHSPWVFPALLAAAGIISNFSNRRIPETKERPQKISWVNLWLFAFLFIGAGILSEAARVRHWEHGRVFNLFENFYRFGTIVFGGGQALLPMMLYQFVYRPLHRGAVPWLRADELLTGYGMVQALPGPVFAVCAYVGGLSLSSYGPVWQLLGCMTATVGVFLPSILILLFFFPVYQHLKRHVVIFRALEGINAAIVGIIWASGLMLFQSIAAQFAWSNLVVVVITFSLLSFTKIPAPLIVLGWLLLGWTMH
jgi:chromate transporter